ncbi:MAG TPA: 1,4-alpha-glucan branching protein GlgB [Planctomycetaceae bacterium]|jgi:1,4-alpha-glucan branching enzyme|nr:1,4-alpha-glucan branching protein GlgB [Planctomycetaceae bacterium]
MNSGSSAPTTRERLGVPYAASAEELARRRVNRRRIDRPEMQGETNCSMYRTLGAHPDVVDGAAGTRFAVWAPNAAEVSVVCNANGWKPGQSKLWGSDSGIWSGFVPGVKHGDVYKYVLRTRDGRMLEKSDPVAFYAEVPPHSASIVYQLPDFPWQDGAWMHKRAHTNWFEQPISIYEVHLASWKRPKDGRRYLNYRELANQLVDYMHEMGYTHLQLMPLSEFPFDGSWGYQTTGYFAPTSRFGTPEDFMHFVDYCHQANLGVIIDWVPAHFPSDGHALGQFDGTSLYEHSDPRQGMHPDWGTLIFNYGRSEVRDFLLSSARFWVETYHVDGLRVDAVASMLYLDYSRKAGEWVPNPYGGRENLEAIQFVKDLNVHLHGAFPGILTIAEESTAWGGVSAPVYNGGLGFSMKWDMGWMNDTLRYLRHEAIHRKYHQNELSFRMVYAFTENFILPLSHDEVVHGKRALISQMPGDYWQQFANLRLLYGYQYTMPGKKLLFMGGEFGQWTEWNYDSELDWALFGHKYHDSLRRYVGDLNRIYRSEPALYEVDFKSDGFRWIQADDYQNSVYAYYRIAKDPNQIVVVLENFTPVPRQKYRVGVPRAGCYRELINSDAAIYGGGNIGNAGTVYTEPIPAHGHAQSLSLTLPPLGMLMLKPV